MKGKFTVKKTKHAFSAIALDQAHEQNNAFVKGDGRAVGLTKNSSLGPEMAGVIGEFENSTKTRQDNELRHHEQRRRADAIC